MEMIRKHKPQKNKDGESNFLSKYKLWKKKSDRKIQEENRNSANIVTEDSSTAKNRGVNCINFYNYIYNLNRFLNLHFY